MHSLWNSEEKKMQIVQYFYANFEVNFCEFCSKICKICNQILHFGRKMFYFVQILKSFFDDPLLILIQMANSARQSAKKANSARIWERVNSAKKICVLQMQNSAGWSCLYMFIKSLSCLCMLYCKKTIQVFAQQKICN